VPIGLRPRQLSVASAGEIGRVRAAYGLGEAYLLYVGNFKPHKNLARLVRAFARLPESARGSHQLVLAGSLDAFTASLRDEARALALDERVRFPGFVAEADLAALYGGATALVFPSLLEGFGVPVLEAMACGTPVVCSDIAPLAELAEDAALLVDPWREEAIAAGIAQALADEALRCRLAAAGRRRAALFTSAGSADAIRDVLAEAVEARGR
jgi:glycosyltransferase involved in cell wall biosynthesis